MDRNKNAFDSTNVFAFLIRWWKHLFVICMIAAVGAAVFSGPRFITPKFQSTVTMFPATGGSVSRAVMSGAASRQDFLDYGEVEDAERLLQVLESGNVRDRVAERFNLFEHYEIPGDAAFRRTILNEIYRGNISFRRTQFGAVEVRVRDHDPAMAAKIANELAALADTVQNELRLERAELAYNVAKTQYNILRDQVRQAEDSLRKIMGKGVFDLEGQSAMLTRQLAKDLSANNTEGIRVLEERLALLGDYGGAYVFNAEYLANLAAMLIQIQRRYQEAQSDLESFVPFKFILDSAFESERKVYPTRWIIVFLATFATGLMGVMILMVYETLVDKGLIKQRIKKNSKS